MRKAIIILLITFTARCFVSCCRESGYTFRWTALRLTNINQPPGNGEQVLTADSARISNYAFRMNIANERIAKQSFSELGFSTAYAFKCVALYTHTDTIVSLNVVTRNALDAAHLAGSNINSLVQGRSSYAYRLPLSHSAWQPLSVVQQDLNYDRHDSHIEGDWDLRINNITPFTGQHRFVVTAVLASGNVMADSTNIRFY